MNILDVFRPPAHVTAFAASGWTPADVQTAGTEPVATPGAHPSASALSASLQAAMGSINESVGMSIPAVRRAVHVIAGTISTFGLAAWRQGIRLKPKDEPGWLTQPDPQKTLTTTLSGTMRDAIWHDRCVWKILSRDVTGLPRHMRRIKPDRLSITTDTYDSDLLQEVTIDGAPVNLRDLVVFNFAGVGGLQRWGFDILDLYMDLQAAAGKYAKAPHPKAILKNHGADLNSAEIGDLLAAWEAARETKSVGYLNDVVDYETFGWNAAELQLNDAREYAALEVARLFGLPAWSLDAQSGGDSMTYSNVTDRRLDLLEALRPWMTPVEQTLGMDDRLLRPTGLVLPHGTTVTFDASAYTRDSPEARMRTWEIALSSGVLTLEEVRRVEPLADLAAGSPDQPGTGSPATPPTPAPMPGAGVGNPAPGEPA